MSDITMNLNPMNDAEYQAAIDLMLAEMSSVFGQIDKTCAESEQIRIRAERLGIQNAATLREIREELSALRR